jgi:hypothetical protein
MKIKTILQYVLDQLLDPDQDHGNGKSDYECPRCGAYTFSTRPHVEGLKDRFSCFTCKIWGDVIDIFDKHAQTFFDPVPPLEERWELLRTWRREHAKLYPPTPLTPSPSPPLPLGDTTSAAPDGDPVGVDPLRGRSEAELEAIVEQLAIRVARRLRGQPPSSAPSASAPTPTPGRHYIAQGQGGQGSGGKGGEVASSDATEQRGVASSTNGKPDRRRGPLTRGEILAEQIRKGLHDDGGVS